MKNYSFRKKGLLFFAGAFWLSGSLLFATALPIKIESLAAVSSGWPGFHHCATTGKSQSMIVHFRADSDLEIVADLEPLEEFDLLAESGTSEAGAPDHYDPVRLTLSSSGNFLYPDRCADIIHPEIEKAYKIHSFPELEKFLTKTKLSEWRKYITFFSEDEPGLEKSIEEIRYLVSRKQALRVCTL